MRVRAPIALIVATALSCAPPNGRLIVVVTTDLPIATSAADATSLGAVVVTVRRTNGSAPAEMQTFAVRETEETGTFTMPLSFAVAPTSSDANVEIAVDGTNRSGTTLVSALARVRIVPGPTRILPMFLADACRGVRCPPEETCDRGPCVPIPNYDLGADAGLTILTEAGAELRFDSSFEDGGSVDASGDGGAPDTDAGGSTCRPQCSCPTGQTCDFLYCPGGPCSVDCEAASVCTVLAIWNSNVSFSCTEARCEITAQDAVVDLACGNGSICNVNCLGTSDCTVACPVGSMCTVTCRDASTCEITGCAESVMSCIDVDARVYTCETGSCP